MPSLSRRTLGELRQILTLDILDWEPRAHLLVDAIDAALKTKRSVTLSRKRVAKKKATRKEKTASVREAVMARADGKCECCGAFSAFLEMDHFRSGAHKRSNETVEGCWALSPVCHRLKTDNRPSRLCWLTAFREHCRKHEGAGYTREAREAERLIDAVHLSAASASRVSPSLEENNR